MKTLACVNLTIEQARTLYKEGGTGKQIALSVFTEQELIKQRLPKSFQGLVTVSGVYVDVFNALTKITQVPTSVESNKNIYPERFGQAAQELPALLQLMDRYNDGWIADWEDESIKYCIVCNNLELQIVYHTTLRRLLCFKTNKLAQEFIDTFHDQIMKAKELI